MFASGTVMRLEPLQSLPFLTRLYVSGRFTNIHKLAHLTSLELQDAEVVAVEDCRFASGLVELSLTDSNLKGLHRKSLSACLLLSFLSLDKSSLIDAHDNLYFAANLAMPLQLNRLKQLSVLQLTSVFAFRMPQLDWVFALTSLQALSLSATQCKPNLIERAHNLTDLTHLTLQATYKWPVLHLNCQSNQMQALQRLEFDSLNLVVSKESAVGLLQLDKLTFLSFHVPCPLELDSQITVAALVYQLARLKPHTKVLMNGSSLQHHLDLPSSSQ